MDPIYQKLQSVKHWKIICSSEVQSALDALFKENSTSHLRGSYARLKAYLTRFPPASSHWSDPLQDMNDPWTFIVHTEGHLRLRIVAKYVFWSQTVTLVDIKLDYKSPSQRL
jgi:hypothetical protein